MSGAATRDKHGVPDGKLVAYKKLHLIKIFNFIQNMVTFSPNVYGYYI